MAKSIYVSKKQLANLRSGQTYWSVAKNQFGEYSLYRYYNIGKKTNSYAGQGFMPEEKSFLCKRKQEVGIGMRRSTTITYPKYKLFWSKKVALRFIGEHVKGLWPTTTVALTHKRTRPAFITV